ncbi:MAG: cache domain-containing protein, partial [Caldicoprobacterales bacterium]
MIHLKKAFKEKIFVRFMTSYLLVLFIPLIVGLIAYNEALKIVEHDSKEASLSTLEQGMVVLDSRLSEIENMVTQLALNYKVLGFAREYSPYVDGTVPCKINDIREQLAPLTVNNKFISNLYIYFNRSDVMISPNSSYINLDCFYGGIFQYGNMSNADWRENVLNNKFNKKYFPVNQVYLRTDYDTNKLTNSSMIMYVQSFPFGKLDKGQIIVLLSKSKIEELFEDVSIKQGGWAYILDNDGEVITTISSSGQYINVIDIDPIESKGCMVEKIEDQKVIMTYVKSPYNGWRYVAVLPYHKVMEKVLYIKQIIITTFMVSLLIGIVCAYLLTCRNYKPILNIVNTIKELMGNNVGE